VTPEERIAEYDSRQRFRPYRQRGRRQVWLAAAGCPTEDGVVTMLRTLKEDGEFTDRDSVGILDTAAWEQGEAATWLINPHATGER
jgi:hypothetical protein